MAEGGARADGGGRIGFWAAVAIGVGGMVGGGIFAVLGLAVQLARGGAPLAFLVAGAVALLTSYSYARLSVALPSQGGTVTFLDRAFGPGVITGALNILLWISYIAMLSLYSFAFGSYGATFFSPAAQGLWKHVLITASVLAIAALNVLSAKLIGEAEEWIVAAKVTILLLFVGVGVWSVEPSRLAPSAWAQPLPLLAGGMIIFLAYEGFELIANTAQDVRNPARTLPRAFYSAVGFVIVLYVLVAGVTVGNLSVGAIVGAKDYALAEAARPFLGHPGFVLITIAALLSTASAINATLYGAARLSYIIAKDGELPPFLEHKVWKRPIEGLIITVVATLLVANLFDLSSISTMGSAGFLLIFAAVNWANLRLSEQTDSRRWIAALGAALCGAALASLVWETARDTPAKLLVLLAMLVLAVAIEVAYRRWTGRGIDTSASIGRASHPDA
jgi:amino acid transporter